MALKKYDVQKNNRPFSGIPVEDTSQIELLFSFHSHDLRSDNYRKTVLCFTGISITDWECPFLQTFFSITKD